MIDKKKLTESRAKALEAAKADIEQFAPTWIDEVLEVSKALKWVRASGTGGYSESWLNGYEKAYEEIKNELPKLTSHIEKEILKGRAEELKLFLDSQIVKPEYHNALVGKWRDLNSQIGEKE